MSRDAALADLQALLGPRLSRSAGDLADHGRNETWFAPMPPDAVAFPETTAEVSALVAVCARHGVKLIEAALRFPLLHPAVVSVIPGGQSPTQVLSNRAILDAAIPDALWAELKAEGLMRANAPTP